MDGINEPEWSAEPRAKEILRLRSLIEKGAYRIPAVLVAEAVIRQEASLGSTAQPWSLRHESAPN